MNDFPLFAALSLLYFAAASFSETARRLDRPQRNSRESRSERTFTFVLVETDAGLTGLGDAYGDQALMPTIVERRLRPMALGLDPCDAGAVWRRRLPAL